MEKEKVIDEIAQRFTEYILKQISGLTNEQKMMVKIFLVPIIKEKLNEILGDENGSA